MFVRRNKRQVPGVNTASTADISFMLLIFFLVTTSMDVDKGLFRLLPSPEPQKQLKTETIVDKKTLMVLHVTADHRLLLNDKPIEVSRLKGEIIQFVNRLGNRHLISIESDREADYDLYFQMQNQIMMAYNELRNQYSMKHFGKAFDALSSSQKESVRKNCQQRVTESYANASVGSDKRVDAMAEEQEHSDEKGGKQ